MKMKLIFENWRHYIAEQEALPEPPETPEVDFDTEDLSAPSVEAVPEPLPEPETTVATATTKPPPPETVPEPETVPAPEIDPELEEARERFRGLSPLTREVKLDPKKINTPELRAKFDKLQADNQAMQKEQTDMLLKHYEPAVELAKNRYKEYYSSPESVKTYVRYAKNMGSDSGRSDEELANHYKRNILPTINYQLENINIRNTITDFNELDTEELAQLAGGAGAAGAAARATGWKTGGFYDSLKNRITVNPLVYRIGPGTTEKMARTIGEEISHLIDGNIQLGQLSPYFGSKEFEERFSRANPGATAADIERKREQAFGIGAGIKGWAEYNNLIKSHKEVEASFPGVMDDYEYNYLTIPSEVYAKLKTIRTNMPKEFFDESGKIKRDKLADFLTSRNLLDDHPIFRIINLEEAPGEDKLGKIGELFDMLVKVDPSERPPQRPGYRDPVPPTTRGHV